MFAFQNNPYMCWSPASQEVTRHHFLMGCRELNLWGFSFARASHFILVNCLYLSLWGFFHLISFPHLAERRRDFRGTWCQVKINPPQSHLARRSWGPSESFCWGQPALLPPDYSNCHTAFRQKPTQRRSLWNMFNSFSEFLLMPN